ncbi:hypothetical protein [Nocardia paucivorans]|uniref:hypothetical protein n=1 Tax=Nocardia paucivorans TaxID=114259 RepID=UPI0012F8FABC|nr:hypothetical protein [Nocardia paucivorans]
MGATDILTAAVTDVAVTTLVAGRGGALRGAFASALGGAIAEGMVNGNSPENWMKGAVVGGLVGGVTHRAAQGLTKPTADWAKKSQKQLDAANAFKGAHDDLKSTFEKMRKTKSDLDKLTSAPKKRGWTDRRAQQKEIDDKKGELDSAKVEFRQKALARREARKNLKAEKLPYRGAGPNVDKVKAAHDRKTKLKELFQQGENLHLWQGRGPALLAALTSTGAVLFDDITEGIGNFFGGDEGGGEKKKPGTQDTIALDLLWVGAGAAGSKLGKEPFVETPGITDDGDGFLLQPKSIHPTLAEWHGGNTNSVASTVVENYDLYGDPEKIMKDPKADRTLNLEPVPTLRASDKDLKIGASDLAGAYNVTVNDIKQKTQRLDAGQRNVAMVVTEVEKITEAGRTYIADFIEKMNHWVQNASDGSNGAFLMAMAGALDEMTEKIEMDNASNEKLAQQLAKQEEQLSKDQKAAQDLANQVGQNHLNQYDPNTWARLNPNNNGNNVIDDPSKVNGYDPKDIDPTKDSEWRDRIKDLEDASKPDLNQTNTPDLPGVNTPGSNIPGSNDLGANMPGSNIPGANMSGMPGMNPLSDMGPLVNSMMMQDVMRRMAEGNMAARQEDLDPSRYEQALTPPAPPTTPAPTNTTPWSNQNAAAQQAAHTTPSPSTSSSGTSAPTGAIPPQNPDDKKGRLFDFGDGRQQWVCNEVYEGLTKAFANKKGTDAQEAYAGTPAMWTDAKEIEPIDTLELMTGDVVVWDPVPAETSEQSKAEAGPDFVVSAPTEKGKKPESASDDGTRTAILVVFGPPETGTLEVVVNGELRPFAPEMSDSGGNFGAFAGFRRPKGIEAVPQPGEQMATGVSDQPATPAADASPMVASA